MNPDIPETTHPYHPTPTHPHPISILLYYNQTWSWRWIQIPLRPTTPTPTLLAYFCKKIKRGDEGGSRYHWDHPPLPPHPYQLKCQDLIISENKAYYEGLKIWRYEIWSKMSGFQVSIGLWPLISIICSTIFSLPPALTVTKPNCTTFKIHI